MVLIRMYVIVLILIKKDYCWVNIYLITMTHGLRSRTCIGFHIFPFLHMFVFQKHETRAVNRQSMRFLTFPHVNYILYFFFRRCNTHCRIWISRECALSSHSLRLSVSSQSLPLGFPVQLRNSWRSLIWADLTVSWQLVVKLVRQQWTRWSSIFYPTLKAAAHNRPISGKICVFSMVFLVLLWVLPSGRVATNKLAGGSLQLHLFFRLSVPLR